MTFSSRARLSASIRSRLIDTARSSASEPATAVTLNDIDIWADAAPAALRTLGHGAVYAEYLIGFHGLAPEDAIFETASLPRTERDTCAAAAWSDMRATIADRAPPRRVSMQDVIRAHT